MFKRSSVVVAKKFLWDAAIAWKAWTEMRNVVAKSVGEREDYGAWSWSFSWRISAGSGGPKGELGGDAKSISNGQSWAMESWETEL